MASARRPHPMRIPWYIAFILALTVFSSVLWIGSRNKDFTSEPTSQEVNQAVTNWKRKHPPLPPRARPLVSAAPSPITVKLPVKPPAAIIPLGNLTNSPELNHYSEYRNLESTSFIKLAQQLEQKGALTHALLAWERVIDNTNPSSDQIALAHKAITQIHRTSPSPSIDKSQSFSPILHIHTPKKWKAPLSSFLGQLSDDILKDSRSLITPQILIKVVPKRSGYPTPPVRIWLSAPGDTAIETPHTTFHPKNNKPRNIENQLYLALFRSITGQLSQLPDISATTEISENISPREALSTHLTRRHWSLLRDSLKTKTQNAPPPVLIKTTPPQE